MSDRPPERLRSDARTSSTVRALLDAARPPAEMSDEAFARSAAAIGAIGSGAAAGAAASKLLGSGLAKLLAVLGATATIGIGAAAVWWSGAAPAASTPPSGVEPQVTPAARPTPVPSSAVPSRDPSPTTLPATSAPPTSIVDPGPSLAPAPPRATLDPLVAETRLLGRARAVVRSDPARALRLADQHARRFGDGQLGHEREAIAIEALVGLGHAIEARARAERFLAGSPGALYERRVRRIVGR